MRKILTQWGVPALLFLLPWQTIWIFNRPVIAGHSSEFGVMGLYLVQALLLVYILLRPCEHYPKQYKKSARNAIFIIILALVSVLFAVQKEVAVFQVMHIAFAMLLFIALLAKHVSPKRVLVGFTAGLAIPAGVGVYQVIVGAFPSSMLLGIAVRDAAALGDSVIELGGSRVLRAYGSFPHPNIFAGYLAVGVAGITGMWHTFKTKTQIIFFGISGALLSVALLLTFSRAAWIGLALGVGLGFLVRVMKNTARARQLVIPIAVVVIGAAVLFAAGRFGGSLLEQQSVNERVEQYSEYTQVLGSHWVIGMGPDNYPFVQANALPDKEWWQYQPIHNTLLLIIAEVGVIGLLAVLWWASNIDKINFSRFPNKEAVAAFMMGNVILVILFFDHYIWSTWAGLALAAYVMAMTLRLGEE